MQTIHKALHIILLVVSLSFIACETEFIPKNINLDPEIVVEGYIEYTDSQQIPPYVILTKSKPFFSSLSVTELENLFVHNATVSVLDNENKSVTLKEICLNDIPANVRPQVSQALGLNPDSVRINFCVYTDLSFTYLPKEGNTYQLKIIADGKTITSITQIPKYVPLDSLWWREAPGKPSDTLLQLMSVIKDPVSEVNFYRYSCSTNAGTFVYPFNSVFDDPLINGKRFEFRLIRPNRPGEDFDQSTFGLFKVGDSVEIKWSTIDEGHYRFWETFEFNRGNQGPFATYTTINSNIKGGLGVWGGYNSRIYKLKVKRG